ncbi:MAG: hypothetical protein IPP69_05385 [Flavobacteriales bacterium]|nr:hypothetical protein [Flavobacteriales bacterium]
MGYHPKRSGIGGNTDIICIPECGRNLQPNSILDSNQWAAYDHSDENSLRIWSLMAGPSFPQNTIIGSEGNQVGKVSDAMLTAARILGVKDEVLSAGYVEGGTYSFIDLL